MPATVDAIEAFPQRGACTHRLDVYLGPSELRLPLADFIRGAGLTSGHVMAQLDPKPFIRCLVLPLPADATMMCDRSFKQSRDVKEL